MNRRRRVLGACGALLCGVSLYLVRLCRLRRETRVRDETQQHHEALAAHATLPLYVDHDALPGRWQVQVPVYYPPRRAALLLVRPALLSPTTHHGKDTLADSRTSDRRGSTAGGHASYEGSLCSEMSILVMCEGPLRVPRPCDDTGNFLLDYLTHHAMFQAMFVTYQGTTAAQLVPVTTLLPRCASGVFSHAILHDSTVVLCGLNECYVSVLVWPLDAATADRRTSSPTTKAETSSVGEDTNNGKTPTTPLLTQEQQILCEVVSAIHTVPLVREADASSRLAPRPPGAPAGVQCGEYHVRCTVAGHMAVFKVPAWLAVCDCRAHLSMQAAGAADGGPAPALLSFVPCVTRLPGVSADSANSQAEAFVLTKNDFSALCVHASPQQKEGSLADHLLAARAATPVRQQTAEPTREAAVVARAVTVSHVIECEDDAEENVTVVYTQPIMRVSFGVDAKHGQVLDCMLSSHLQVIYYPFGFSVHDEMQGRPDMDSAARITLRYMTPLPPSWERAVGDEAELRHNVLLHFTDWTHGQTPCTVTELSGLRCVQFAETKEGWRCRTYVVPRENSTVLVILLEAHAEVWARCEPCFDAFMDTLNISDEVQ